MKAPFNNPFLNRVMIREPESFLGRAREVQSVFNRLNASTPQSVAVVGMRRIGKSSLLYYCTQADVMERYLDKPSDYIFSFLDLQSISGTDANGFFHHAGELARVERPDISLQETHDQQTFLELVRQLDEQNICWVILLDEFEVLTCNPNFGPEFFSFLRFLANNHNLAYITATGEELGKLCHAREIADSPFFNIFTSIRLGPFSLEDAEKLIADFSSKAGLSLKDYSQAIIRKTGCIPMFLQMGCAAAFDFLSQNNIGAEPDWSEIQEMFMDEARVHFTYLWQNLSEDERFVLDQIVAKKEINDKKLAHSVRSLTKNGLLEYNEDKHVISSEWFYIFLCELPEKMRENSPESHECRDNSVQSSDDQSLPKSEKTSASAQGNHKTTPLKATWFYLFIIVIIMGLVAFISQYVSWYALLVIVVAGLITPILIGALHALNEGSLSEKGFLEVVRESYKILPKVSQNMPSDTSSKNRK